MTAIDPTSTANAIDVLFGSADSCVSIETLFRDHSCLGPATTANHLSKNTYEALQHELSAVTSDLLDVDLIDLLVHAWRLHSDLVAAARRTAETPGSTEIVELATHRVSSRQRPYIDLVVDNVSVGRVQLELDLNFIVRAALAVVKGGKLIAVRCGDFSVEVSFAIEGEQVARHKSTFDLPGEVKLGQGVPLVTEQTSASAQQ